MTIFQRLCVIFNIPSDVLITHENMIMLIKKVTGMRCRVSKVYRDTFYIKFLNRHSDARYNYLDYLILDKHGKFVNRTAFRTKKEKELKNSI